MKCLPSIFLTLSIAMLQGGLVQADIGDPVGYSPVETSAPTALEEDQFQPEHEIANSEDLSPSSTTTETEEDYTTPVSSSAQQSSEQPTAAPMQNRQQNQTQPQKATTPRTRPTQQTAPSRTSPQQAQRTTPKSSTQPRSGTSNAQSSPTQKSHSNAAQTSPRHEVNQAPSQSPSASSTQPRSAAPNVQSSPAQKSHSNAAQTPPRHQVNQAPSQHNSQLQNPSARVQSQINPQGTRVISQQEDESQGTNSEGQQIKTQSPPSPYTKTDCYGPQPIRLSVRHIEPNGIGYNQGYTTLAGFFPYVGSGEGHWVPFLDVRGHIFNNGQPAANAGLGLRYVNNRIWGINTYYDYRKTNRQHYNQVAAGLETLGKLWDFRINGYLPVGKKASPHYGLKFDGFEGHYMMLSRKQQFAMKGANAEVGFHLDQMEDAPFYIAAGPYYLTGEGKTAWGGQLRVACDLFQYLHLEGNTSYDHQFKWIGQGQIGINIPLGRKAKLNPKNRSCDWEQMIRTRAIQGVDRFEIIPTKTKHTDVAAQNPTTNQPYYFVFVDNTSHSQGTYESPYATLADAQTNSSAGDIIYIFPGDGTSNGLTTTFNMKNNQKLLGSSLDYNMATQFGVVKLPAQTTGLPQLITAGQGATSIELANDNEVAGLYVSASGHTIRGGNPKNAFIHDNYTQGSPLYLQNASGVITVQNNTIQSSNSDGLAYFNTNGVSSSAQLELNILDNTINNSTYAGMFIGHLNETDSFVTNISGNTITTSGWDAIRMEIDAPVTHIARTISHNTLSNTNTLQDTETGAIGLQNVSAYSTVGDSMVITYNTINGSGEQGIQILNSGTGVHDENITIAHNTISSTVNSAIHFMNRANGNIASQSATISNNTLSYFNEAGVSLEGDGTATSAKPLCFTIENNTLSATTDASGGILLQPQLNLNANINNNTIGTTQTSITINSLNNTNACVLINDNTVTTNMLLEQSGSSTVQIGSFSGNNKSASLSGTATDFSLTSSTTCDCD